MASFNKVILIGHLTADPELKQTTSGLPVTSFSIGVNRRFTKQGEQPILICGSLQTRSWVDKDGNKRYTTEVVADEATFVERKSDSSAPQGGIPAYGTPKADDSFEELSADDELPF